ncbi:hypothetical protein L1887_56851 [Cichorium endivia]|nr:hypothetical protein L1887_56851 [Cichorium endivia]
MLTLEPFSEDQGRSAVHPARGIPPISFLAPCGFTHPLTRTHVRLLGPCFKTGRMGCPQAGAGSTQPWTEFTALLGAAFPNNPTRRQAPRGATGSGHDGALTLSGAPFQGTWARSAAEDASPDYNSDSEAVRFSSWADPGSLAVTKGILHRLKTTHWGLHQGPSLTAHDARHNTRVFSTTTSRASTEGDSSLGQPHHKHGRPISAPMPCVPIRDAWLGATRCVTPRQACPRAGWLWAQTCVQKLDGSRDSAIHTKYRILLRSSSMREPEISVCRESL